MPEFDWKQFLRDTLSELELTTLNTSLTISLHSERHLAIRNFFLQEEIFDKVKTYADPMWLANTIFTEGYGFKF